METGDGYILRKIHENCFVYGLDMLFSKEQIDDLNDIINFTPQNQAQTRGTIVTRAKYNWPNRTIPYTFNSNITEAHKIMIKQAMDVWQTQTQIKLVPRAKQKDYVEFISGVEGRGKFLRIFHKTFSKIFF